MGSVTWERPLGRSYEEIYFFTARKFLLKNIRYLKAVKQLDEIGMVLVLANIELGKLNYQDSIYSQHIQEIN